MAYIRFQAPQPNHRGVHLGVFALANKLAHDGELSAEEHQQWRAMNDWYNQAYPNPSSCDPTIYDPAHNPGAVAWFKDSAEHLIRRVEPYLRLLAAHEVPCEKLVSSDPGPILYEDEFQIVVAAELSQPTMPNPPRPQCAAGNKLSASDLSRPAVR
ncbi:hypothetical protein GCM10027417_19470 [Glutamicibacter endophyticus]